jgi:DNA polymerase V
MNTFADTFDDTFDGGDESARYHQLAPVLFDMPNARICATVPCGKPTTIFSQVQGKFLSAYLSKHPNMTFLFEATGDSMRDAGISEGDIIAVDCRLEPHDGNIVLAEINGELTLKRLGFRNNTLTKVKEMLLLPANPRHKTIVVKDYDEVRIFGVAATKITFQELV